MPDHSGAIAVHRSPARGYLLSRMPRRYAANSLAPPEAAWSLIAEPDRWHEWAPHLRGAWGLGSPEVLEKKVGVARVFGLVPVPAQIVHKKPGRSWTWRVGPVILVHTVEPRGNGGSQVSVVLQSPEPIETLLAATYGPVMQLLMDNLARVAARTS